MTRLTLSFGVAFLLIGCNVEPPDRTVGPTAAYEAAKVALSAENMEGYVDSLTDEAVLQLLGNAIFLCVGHLDGRTRPIVPESPGCEDVLEEHHFPYRGLEAFNRRGIEELRIAVRGLDLRKLTAELESFNRKGSGSSSFVWGFLDETVLRNVVVFGTRGSGVLLSNYGDRTIQFELDATGWRMGWEKTE